MCIVFSSYEVFFAKTRKKSIRLLVKFDVVSTCFFSMFDINSVVFGLMYLLGLVDLVGL